MNVRKEKMSLRFDSNTSPCVGWGNDFIWYVSDILKLRWFNKLKEEWLKFTEIWMWKKLEKDIPGDNCNTSSHMQNEEIHLYPSGVKTTCFHLTFFILSQVSVRNNFKLLSLLKCRFKPCFLVIQQTVHWICLFWVVYR